MTLRKHLRFEEPPAAHQQPVKKTKHGAVAAKLRRRPGEWAHIGSYSTTLSATAIAYQIRNGRLAAYTPAGHYEAVARTEGNRVWARYVGDGGATT